MVVFVISLRADPLAAVDAARFPVAPLVIAIAFMPIADIDAPRRGLIAVVPQNLVILKDALRAQ